MSAGAAMSQNRDETIANFQAITGIDDVSRCVAILEEHSWHLETAAAVSLAQHDPFEPGAGSGAAASMGASSGPTRRAAAAHGTRPQPDAAAPRDSGQNGAQPRRGILGFLSRLVGGGEEGGRRRADDTQRFLELFNLEHGTVHPTPHIGTFRQAVDVAKRDFKFLVVYLHSPHHQDTPAFLRDTLCTQVMQDFVDDNFVFWMGTLLFAEGYNASSLLRASGFPYLAVITTIDNQTTVCDAHEGLVSKEDLMHWLINIMDTQGPQLVAMRAEAEERLNDRRIRQEQDAAYQEALLQDQLREQRRNEAEENERRESMLREQEEAAARAAAREAEEEQQRKEDAKRKRKAEMQAKFQGAEPAGPGTALIAFKLPSGERRQRRFMPTDTVQMLYDYLEAYGEIEFEHFEIATNLPKVVYNDLSATLEAAGLAPQAMLFVSEKL